MKKLTAIIIGASGATGFEIVKQTLENPNFDKVKVFVRKNLALDHEKLEQHLVDFDHIETWKAQLTGDVLFSALGTTIKIAKTKANQYKIDHTYQYEVAKAAAENGIQTYVLVSSYGASPTSKIFYSRMKGELEEAIKQLSFKSMHIFQPGILDRHQNDDRSMERTSLKVIRFLNKLGILKSQRPMPVEVLASKMIQVSLKDQTGVHYYQLNKIFEI